MALKLNMANILKAATNVEIDVVGGRAKIGEVVNPSTFVSQAQKSLQNKPQHVQYLNTIDQAITDESLLPIVKSQLPGIINLKPESIKRAYLSLDSENKARNFTNAISIAGLSDIQSYRNTRSFIKQTLRNVEHSYKQSFRLYEQKILKGLKTVKNTKSFELLMKSPNKFSKLIGRNQEQMFRDFYNGQTDSADPIVKDIIKVVDEVDKSLFENLNSTGATVSKNPKDFLPFHLSSDNVEAIGEDQFKLLLHELTDLDEVEADNLIRSLEKSGRSLDHVSASLNEQTLKFKSTDHMLSFFKAINQSDFSLNLFNEFFMQRQRLIRTAHLQSVYGKSPLETISRAVYKSRNRLDTNKFDPTLTKSYDSLLKDFKLKLNLLTGKRFIDDETWYRLSNILNKAMSYLTFSPARSAPRNLILDYEGHNLSIGHTLYDGGTTIGRTAKNIFKNLYFLLNQSIGNPKQKQAINEILEIAGWANSVDGIFHGNVLSFEDVFDSNIGSSKATNALHYVDSKMVQGLDALYKWSGNHSLIDISRARRMTSIQQLFTNVFNYTNYDEWRASLSTRELQQLDFLKTNFDLDESTFNFLKEANRTRVNFDADALYGLGFKRFPEFISKQSILDTPDIIANRFKRKHETAAQYKQRIARGWQSFVYNSTTRKTPIPSVADSLTGPLLSNTPAWVGLTFRPFFKFADSAQAQMVNWVESMGNAVYGRPVNYIGWDRSTLAWARGLSVYLAYGAAVVWMKDLFNNRKPTDFTNSTNIKRLIAISGFGGYANMAAAGLLGVFPSRSPSLYSTTPIGAVANQFHTYKKAYKKGGVKNLAADVLRYNPVSKLWYASGATDYLLNQLLLEPYQIDQRYTNMERYGKPYLFE